MHVDGKTSFSTLYRFYQLVVGSLESRQRVCDHDSAQPCLFIKSLFFLVRVVSKGRGPFVHERPPSTKHLSSAALQPVSFARSTCVFRTRTPRQGSGTLDISETWSRWHIRSPSPSPLPPKEECNHLLTGQTWPFASSAQSAETRTRTSSRSSDVGTSSAVIAV